MTPIENLVGGPRTTFCTSAVPQRTFNLCLHPFMHVLLGLSFEKIPRKANRKVRL